MALLDQILGSLMGNAGAGSPLQSVVTNLLANAGNQASAPAANQGAGNQGIAAGIGGLLSMFQQAGLGHIAESWIGNGPNQSVSPDQLQSVFGQGQVQNMASQAGMAPGDFLSQLSQHLPNVVNGVTPNGRLPSEGTMSV